jgi:hypothetical protein
MRTLLTALALAGATIGAAPSIAQDRPAASPAPVDPDRLALAQQVVDLAYPPEMRRAMYYRVVDAMLTQSRTAAFAAAGMNVDAGEQQILDRYFERTRVESDRVLTASSPALFAAFARAYARMFTREELVQIRAFVATPAGSKYIQRSADLLSDPDVAEANTAYMRTVFTSLQPLQAQLRQELAAYLRDRDGHASSPSPPPASHH